MGRAMAGAFRAQTRINSTAAARVQRSTDKGGAMRGLLLGVLLLGASFVQALGNVRWMVCCPL
jgi:hypothetical protein